MAMPTLNPEELRAFVRDVPDFPKPGIMFKDVTPLLANGNAFTSATQHLAQRIAPYNPDALVAIESRGFIFGAAVAVRLGIGFIPVRKPGKLPWKKQRVEYSLEYGTDALEMHEDALGHLHRVVVVDDLLATGGTAAATVRLVEAYGAKVGAAVFLIELGFLGGRGKLAPTAVDALIAY